MRPWCSWRSSTSIRQPAGCAHWERSWCSTCPGSGTLARKSGATLACSADAERLLRGGELVGVWPEGYKGSGKPFSERYRLQRFGRGGFVSAALKTGAPIVPCSVVGSEEIYPMVGNFTARLPGCSGCPTSPMTPTFPWLGLFGRHPAALQVDHRVR